MSVKQFDPVIYPQRLWVAVSKDGTDLNGLFRDRETSEIIRFEEYGLGQNFCALTFPVSEVSTDNYGVLIVYAKRKNMTCNIIAHEAVHAAGYMFQHMGQEIDSEEPFAYLVGWIANCCWRVANRLNILLI